MGDLVGGVVSFRGDVEDGLSGEGAEAAGRQIRERPGQGDHDRGVVRLLAAGGEVVKALALGPAKALR